MPRPSGPRPTWATELNYPAGSETWNGTADKVAYALARRNNGWNPDDQPGAQEFNYVVNEQDRFLVMHEGLEGASFLFESQFTSGGGGDYDPVGAGGAIEYIKSGRPLCWIPVGTSGLHRSIRLFAAAREGVAVSADGGRTWASDVSTVPDTGRYSIVHNGKGEIVSNLGADAAVYKRHIDGTWHAAPGQDFFYDLCPDALDDDISYYVYGIVLDGGNVHVGYVEDSADVSGMISLPSPRAYASGKLPRIAVGHIARVVAMYDSGDIYIWASARAGLTDAFTAYGLNATLTDGMSDLKYSATDRLWVLTGDGHCCYKSGDGVNWVLCTDDAPAVFLPGLTFIGGLWVANGQYFPEDNGNPNVLMISADQGATWTMVPSLANGDSRYPFALATLDNRLALVTAKGESLVNPRTGFNFGAAVTHTVNIKGEPASSSNGLDYDRTTTFVTGDGAGNAYRWPLYDIPIGASITGYSIRISPASPHSADPASKPVARLMSRPLNSNAPMTTAATVTDTASGGAYDINHAITKTGLSVTVTTDNYWLWLSDESSTNALPGLVVTGLQISYTTTKPDPFKAGFVAIGISTGL